MPWIRPYIRDSRVARARRCFKGISPGVNNLAECGNRSIYLWSGRMSDLITELMHLSIAERDLHNKNLGTIPNITEIVPTVTAVTSGTR